MRKKNEKELEIRENMKSAQRRKKYIKRLSSVGKVG